MEKVFQQIIQLSSDITEQLDRCGTEEIESYILQRDLLFEELEGMKHSNSDDSSNYRPYVVQIVEMDKIIINKMMELRDEANNELDKLKKGRQSKQNYEMPFTGDSMFFDAKR